MMMAVKSCYSSDIYYTRTTTTNKHTIIIICPKLLFFFRVLTTHHPLSSRLLSYHLSVYILYVSCHVVFAQQSKTCGR